MSHLFDGDDSAALQQDLVSAITEAYRAKLILNPPTPSFNTRTNPKAESFARMASAKDITRLLAVLDDLGLTIVPKSKAVSEGEKL